MSRGVASEAGPKRDYYEVLGVEEAASADDIKKAYRRVALVWHPDKNLHRLEEATERFKEIQNAHAVLSDPSERAWYDSHKDAILGRGGAGGDAEGGGGQLINLYPYFSGSAYSGYDDSATGFYTVFRNLFTRLTEEEKRFTLPEDRDASLEYPSFGNAASSAADVTAFYRFWSDYSSRMSFGWADEYNPLEAPNRYVRRNIEKENKTARGRARRERNDELRALVSFVKRRDKRWLAVVLEQRKKAEEEAERKKAEAQARVKVAAAERVAAAEEHARFMAEYEAASAGAFRIADLEEDEDVRRRKRRGGAAPAVVRRVNATAAAGAGSAAGVPAAHEGGDAGGEDGGVGEGEGGGEGESEEEKEEAPTDWVCALCNKVFRSEPAFANHEASKKHVAAANAVARAAAAAARAAAAAAHVPDSDTEIEEDSTFDTESSRSTASDSVATGRLPVDTPVGDVSPARAAGGEASNDGDHGDDDDAASHASSGSSSVASFTEMMARARLSSQRSKAAVSATAAADDSEEEEDGSCAEEGKHAAKKEEDSDSSDEFGAFARRAGKPAKVAKVAKAVAFSATSVELPPPSATAAPARSSRDAAHDDSDSDESTGKGGKKKMTKKARRAAARAAAGTVAAPATAGGAGAAALPAPGVRVETKVPKAGPAAVSVTSTVVTGDTPEFKLQPDREYLTGGAKGVHLFARANAYTVAEQLGLTCEVCGEMFDTRNALFAHIRSSGHASVKEGGTGRGGKKGKRK